MSEEKITLVEQRRLLQHQLHAQRTLIAKQLNPEPSAKSGYPRSMTMRFLTEHSTLAGSVFTGAATLLVGARYLKSITTALAVYKVVRSASIARKR